MPGSTPPTLQEQNAALEAALAVEHAALLVERERVAKLTEERDLLRASHERLRLELELLRRRIFVGKAERGDTAQIEMEFAAKLAARRPPRREAPRGRGSRHSSRSSRSSSPRARPSGSASRRAARSPGSAAARACSSWPARST